MLKNIIFDLDGTLWQTTDSYVAAYHRLCEYYHVPQTASDQEIIACLGVKLDRFLPQLFPTVEDQRALAYRAMGFSIDYLMEHPEDCCYEGVCQMLEQVSREYEVYIVSNCLDAYVETFLCLCGAKQYVKAFYTIESGEKEAHIARIAATGKTLFVGDSEDDYAAIKDHYGVLFCYAAYGYKPCTHYDYRIEKTMDLPEVLAGIAVKERQLAGKEYRVFSNGENRLTHIRNADGTDYFGFVCYTDDGFRDVVDQLIAACSDRPLLGPIDANTFYPYRFAMDSYDWVLYPDCRNDERVVNCFAEKGFGVKQTYTSTLGTINRKIWKLAQSQKLPEGYRLVRVSGPEAYGYISHIYQVAVEAFAEADYYEPISEQDFTDIYLRNLAAVEPDLVLIYAGQEPVAFNFCYEDPEKRFYVCKTTAIKQAHRHRKLILTLIDHSYQMMTERGYEQVLYHFQSDRLKNLQGIYRGCILKQKHYALMERKP